MTSALLAGLDGVIHGFAPPGEAVPLPFWRPRQVHGAAVTPVGAPGIPRPAADAVLSLEPATAAAVVTADCVPILLATADGRAVAAVHAGWRGLAAGVVEEGVRALRAARPGQRVLAALGPAASGCCYEVGRDVVDAVAPAAGRTRSSRDGRALLDLRGATLDRLLSAGLQGANIDVVGPCTICSDAWPSYRRQGAAAGRIVAFIAPGPR